MEKSVSSIRAEIEDLQVQLILQLGKEKANHRKKDAHKKISFDEKTRKEHLDQRTPLIPYFLSLPLKVHLSGPFVYGMFIPIAFLDVCLIIYQSVCFRLWNLPRTDRSTFVIVDRQHLAYLNGIEKLNCVYCGYANGVFAFARELASQTEEFWCPIKHASKTRQSHLRYHDFVEFGDAAAWKKHPSRRKLKKET